LQSSSLNQR